MGYFWVSRLCVVLTFCPQHLTWDFNFSQSLKQMEGLGLGVGHRTTALLRWVVALNTEVTRPLSPGAGLGLLHFGRRPLRLAY